MALKEAIWHFVVEARVRTYLDSGQKLKTAVWDALKSLNWPDQSEREFERIQTFLRRRRKVMEAANRRRARPHKPSGRPVCELSAVAARCPADRQDWEEPLEADRLDNLKPGQRISERRHWRRLQRCARLRIPSAAAEINRVSPE